MTFRQELSLKESLSYLMAVLLIGYVWITHLLFLYVLPDPMFLSDSIEYLRGPLVHLAGGPLEIVKSRGIGYPLFLDMILRWPGSFKTLLYIQHGMMMAVAVLIAALFLQFFPGRWGWAVLLFTWVGLLARGADLAHSILSESLYTFSQVLAIFFLFRAIRNLSHWSAALAGLCMALALNTRPVGQSLVLSFVVFWIFYHRQHRIQHVCRWAVVGLVLGNAPFVFYNKVYRGIWTTEAIGNSYLFGNLAQYLDIKSVRDPEVRAVLSPVYEGPSRDLLKEKNWAWHSAEGPVQRLERRTMVFAFGKDLRSIGLAGILECSIFGHTRYVENHRRIFDLWIRYPRIDIA